LQKLLKNQYSNYEVSLIVLETELRVDKPPGRLEIYEQIGIKLFCSNEHGEFGAWSQGLAYLQKNAVNAG
jgi:hypothetical protein